MVEVWTLDDELLRRSPPDWFDFPFAVHLGVEQLQEEAFVIACILRAARDVRETASGPKLLIFPIFGWPYHRLHSHWQKRTP